MRMTCDHSYSFLIVDPFGSFCRHAPLHITWFKLHNLYMYFIFASQLSDSLDFIYPLASLVGSPCPLADEKNYRPLEDAWISAVIKPLRFKATQRVWHKQINFHLIQRHLYICWQRWQSKGQKVSVLRFNKVISFFVEAFNRNHSLGLQFGFNFPFRNTIWLELCPTKCLISDLVSRRLPLSQEYLSIGSNLAKM